MDAHRTVICNPIDLPYRYQDFGRGPVRAVFREAADPSVVLFRGRYYLFASMTGGFFHSDDLASWVFVATPQLPEGDYAPDVRDMDGSLYVTASRRRGPCPVLRSRDPLVEPFALVAESSLAYYDPNYFQDRDGRRYLYWGCSNKEPLRGVEVDQDFRPLGSAVDLLSGQPDEHGWERPGESNVVRPPSTIREKLSARLFGTHSTTPFIEGAWMTEHDGTYYLQYAGPGTEYNVYSDGYYTASNPLGPYTYSPDSPFSSKPGGFVTGAGHGSTFQDAHGNWWHAATMRVSVNHHFERRIGLFPAGFDEDGTLFCNQTFGDYPTVVPDGPADPWHDHSPRWMLQSYRSATSATSHAQGHGPELAVDEDIRTWWAAGSTRPGEALTLDMGTSRTVHAIQVNLADHEMVKHKPARPLRDPDEARDAFRAVVVEDVPVRYLLEASEDGTTWVTLHDGGVDPSDAPHRLIRLQQPFPVRFIRVTGISMPWGGVFAISGLRVFGHDGRPRPAAVVPRLQRTQPTAARVRWQADDSADGVVIRYGRRPDRLYHSWQVWGAAELELPTLNAGEDYWIAVDAYNAGGVTPGEAVALSA